MASLEKILLPNEVELSTVRTHIKSLFVPIGLGIITMIGAGFVIGAFSAESGATARLVTVIVAAVILFVVTGMPFLRWVTWTYTLTNKRLIEQKGVLTRSGRIIPLARINDVAFEKGVVDRILGCGTLVIHDASQQSGLRLHDIPAIEEFHRTISEYVISSHEPEARSDEVH
jgi:membrane protein YdbS with pleckstrin-like domain